MTGLQFTDRRTVLQTIAATAFGGGIATGTARVTQDGKASAAPDPANVVEVAAESGHHGDNAFTLSADEIPAGWTTFELDNLTDHTHFAYISKLPAAAVDQADRRGMDPLELYYERVTRPFQWFMDTQDNGKTPDPDDRFSDEQLFPAWFANLLPSGGVGLTAGGQTATTTVNLTPGEYVMECYVKDSNNDFHSYHGMLESLTVTDARGGSAPDSTVSVSVSSDGIDAPDTLEPGRQVVAVEFQDQRLYEHNLGHDVHLLRFDEETTVDDVDGWMNWLDPVQLVSDGTEPGTFIGGVETVLTPDLLEGLGTERSYLHLDLVPGDYAWVAEVPTPSEKGLLAEFTVPFGADGA